MRGYQKAFWHFSVLYPLQLEDHLSTSQISSFLDHVYCIRNSLLDLYQFVTCL